MKTRKSVLKRFKITAKKKLLRRPTRQDHFNIKDPGQKTLAKRRLKKVSKANLKIIRKLL